MIRLPPNAVEMVSSARKLCHYHRNPWTPGRELELHPLQVFVCMRDFRRSLRFFQPRKNFQRRVLRTLESQAGTYPRSSCRIRRFSSFINNLSRRFIHPRFRWQKWLLRCQHDTMPKAVSLKLALFGHNVALLYVLLSRSNFSSNFSDLLNLGSKVLNKV